MHQYKGASHRLSSDHIHCNCVNKYLIYAFSQAAGLRPNVYVFSALIGRAAKRLDYVYLKTILKTMKSMEVWPNELIIQQLECAARYPLSYNQVGFGNMTC